MNLPLDLADKLINDRVEFKQVLDRLKQLEKDGSINSSNIPRVIWEINIECLLAHLVGAVDALLVRINDKLNLGLNIKNVNSGPKNLATINNKLNGQGKGRLLQDLNLAIKEKCWLWTLRDVRNQGLHRSLINIHVAVGGERNIISLRTDPQTDLEIIPYLEHNINRTRKLIEDILRNEPLLRI
jgi:hypothetical protein